MRKDENKTLRLIEDIMLVTVAIILPGVLTISIVAGMFHLSR